MYLWVFIVPLQAAVTDCCSKQLSALLRLQAQWCCCHSGQQHYGMCLSLCLHRNKAVDSSIHSMHECATENGQEGSNLYQQTQSKFIPYGFSFQKYIQISMPKRYYKYVCTYTVHLQLPCLKEHVLTHCMLCPVEICPQVASCQKIFYLDLAYSAHCSCFCSEQKSKNPNVALVIVRSGVLFGCTFPTRLTLSFLEPKTILLSYAAKL